MAYVMISPEEFTDYNINQLMQRLHIFAFPAEYNSSRSPVTEFEFLGRATDMPRWDRDSLSNWGLRVSLRFIIKQRDPDEDYEVFGLGSKSENDQVLTITFI